MDGRELKRVLDQVEPSPERQEAMLECLLEEKRRASPMKPIKKTVTVLVAAALLLMACAFTVATGLDQRMLEYFRGTKEDAQQVSGGVVGVEQSFHYENGWTINIEQVLALSSCRLLFQQVCATAVPNTATNRQARRATAVGWLCVINILSRTAAGCSFGAP